MEQLPLTLYRRRKSCPPRAKDSYGKRTWDSSSFHGAIAATVNIIGRRSHGASEFFILLNNELNVSWRPSAWNAMVRIGGHNCVQPEDPWVIPQVVRKVSGSDHRFVSCYVESFGRFGGP